MLELRWLEVLADHSLEAGIRLLQDLGWNVLVGEMDGYFWVNAGHIVLLKTSSREAVDALLYGMAISFATLPERALEAVRNFAKESSGG